MKKHKTVDNILRQQRFLGIEQDVGGDRDNQPSQANDGGLLRRIKNGFRNE
jgi:hypothetical protein